MVREESNAALLFLAKIKVIPKKNHTKEKNHAKKKKRVIHAYAKKKRKKSKDVIHNHTHTKPLLT